MDQQVRNCKCSHWLITWPIYLPGTVAQGQSHCAHNTISNSHSYHSKWVDPPIPEIQQFQYFALKIRGQGHGWNQIWKSKHGCNILSTRMPFVPYQSGIPFLRYSNFNILSISLKIQGQGHGWGQSWKSQWCNILSTHIPFVPCQSTLPSMRYKIF